MIYIPKFFFVTLIYSEKANKILRNIHRRFDRYHIGQIKGGDFTKFCDLFRIMNFKSLKEIQPTTCKYPMIILRKNDLDLTISASVVWLVFVHRDLLLVATLWAQKSQRFVWPTIYEKEICFESHYFYAPSYLDKTIYRTRKEKEKSSEALHIKNTVYGPRPLSPGALHSIQWAV